MSEKTAQMSTVLTRNMEGERLQAPVEERDDTGLNPDPDERAHEEEDTGDDDDAVHVDDTGFNLFQVNPP
ncbi:MAG: hypothetical protein ACLRWP_17190 [Bilophila wadsworthia]